LAHVAGVTFAAQTFKPALPPSRDAGKRTNECPRPVDFHNRIFHPPRA
jgi:hypothetical protein